jgi:hypothetical protein
MGHFRENGKKKVSQWKSEKGKRAKEKEPLSHEN